MPDMPEWVQVWWWMRATLGDFTPLPQQGDPGAMSYDQYERVRERWIEDGQPTRSPRELVATVTGDPLHDPPPF